MNTVLPDPPIGVELSQDVWVHSSGPFHALDYSFGVRTDDRALGSHVDTLLHSLKGEVAPDHWYSIQHGSGGVELFLNDSCLAQLNLESAAIEWLLWDINRSVAAASTHRLELHAGGVQAGPIGIVVPAPSGNGKSTLVAGLVERGMRYLSDELIALSDDGTELLPYPKPIALKGGSIDLFRQDGAMLEVDARFAGDEWFLCPHDLGADVIGQSCVAGLIIVPRYRTGVTTQLRPLSETEAFLALALNSVNLDAHGEAGTATLAAFAARCRAYELEMSDLEAACRLVHDLIVDDT